MLEDNHEEAQTYQDPNNPSELEQSHVPVIEADTMFVKVTVGEVTHPMETSHWIQWIELFADGESVGRSDLVAGDKPEMEFEADVTKTKKLTARALCNVHGLWENSFKITNNNKK